MGKVEKYITSKIEREGALIFSLIDPCDYSNSKKAIETAVHSHEAGADIILIGGSIGAQGSLLDETTKGIKENVDIPVVLFPGNIATITHYADALYFMSLLNSRNPYWISQAQTLAAPIVKQIGLEALPVGYIVVEPGGTVGWVGDANLVPRNKPKIALALALAGEFSGSRFIVLDVGSASQQGPVPLDMIQIVSKNISVPLIAAGGIKTPKEAADIISAGASAIQIGTILEQSSNAKEAAKRFVTAVKEAGRKRV